MEANSALHNKADYQSWVEKLKKDPGATSEDVLTPTKHDFK